MSERVYKRVYIRDESAMAWQTNPEAGIGHVGAAGHLAGQAESPSQLRADWPDELLMSAVVARDEAAFAVLYDRYVDLVYSASLRILADTQLAEDATQEIFVRLWRRPETFIAQRGRFLSWLMSV